MTSEEITTQAQQIIANIQRTLDTLQTTAEAIMDSIAEERAALEETASFCGSISPNGEMAVENVEHLFDERPESIAALGVGALGRV